MVAEQLLYLLKIQELDIHSEMLGIHKYNLWNIVESCRVYYMSQYFVTKKENIPLHGHSSDDGAFKVIIN